MTVHKKSVLVTAVGTMAATSIVRWLKHTGRYHIIGGNSLPAYETVTSKDVDEFFVLPEVTSDLDAYILRMLDFCRENRVSYYFPTIDEEVVGLNRYRDDFLKCGVLLCIPNKEVVEICHYKDKFCDWIDEHFPEIGIERFSNFGAIENEKYPVFVKPCEGRASIGCQKIRSPEVARLYASVYGIDKALLIQRCIQGRIITVDIVRNDKYKQFFQMQREELCRNANGAGVAVQLGFDAKLFDICNRISNMLKLNGVINAEFFHTTDGYKIIEINPRCSAGVEYSCLAGFDVVSAGIEIANGEPCTCKLPADFEGRFFARRYETYEM